MKWLRVTANDVQPWSELMSASAQKCPIAPKVDFELRVPVHVAELLDAVLESNSGASPLLPMLTSSQQRRNNTQHLHNFDLSLPRLD
jgi:hypothetical protein